MEAASTEAAAARFSVAFLSNLPPRERRLLTAGKVGACNDVRKPWTAWFQGA
jgi:hypothetical protein